MEIIKILLGVVGFFVLIVGAYFFANLDTFLPDDMEEIRNNPNSNNAIASKKAIVTTAIIVFAFCAILII